MRRLLPLILVVLVLGAGIGTWLLSERAHQIEADRLSDLLDRQIAAYLASEPPLPTMPGPPVEGTAAACYLRAIRLTTIDERSIHHALLNWSPASARPVGERGLRTLVEQKDALDLLSRGTRTRTSGQWWALGAPFDEETLDLLRIYKRAAILESAAAIDRGDRSASITRLLELRRFLADFERGGRLTGPLWGRELRLDVDGMLGLHLDFIGMSAADASRSEKFLRRLLALPDATPRGLEAELLHAQCLCRAFVRGDPAFEDLAEGAKQPRGLQVLLDMGPSTAEVIEAWKGVREFSAKVGAASMLAPADRRIEHQRLLGLLAKSKLPVVCELLGPRVRMFAEIAASVDEAAVKDRGFVIALALVQSRESDGAVPADAAALLGPELAAGVPGRFEIRPEAGGTGLVVWYVDGPAKTELIRVK